MAKDAKKAGRVVPASWEGEILGAVEGAKVAPPPPVATARAAPVTAAAGHPPGDVALVRRILGARDPSALAELDAGLVVAGKGEAALAAWLARPVAEDAEDLDADPLDVLRGNLAQIARSLKSLPPGSKVNASVYNSITTAVKAIEGIMSKRPREPTKDEIEERIAARRDDAVNKICEYTREAREKLEADRAELSAWGRSVLGPVGGAELDRRVAAMLGEASA